MSSTAIVIPMLVESKRLHSGAGRASLAVLLFQDIAVAPLLVMTGALSAGGERGLAWQLLTTLAPAAVALTALVVFGRLALAAVLSFRRGNEESRILHGGMPSWWCSAMGWRRRRATLSMALGAFVAGLLLGGNRISPRDRSDDRAVPGPAARALFRLGRRRDQSGVHRRAARPHSWSRRGARGGEGSDAVRARSRISVCRPAPRAETSLLLGPGRRVRLRHDRRRAGGRPHRSHAGDDAHQRGGHIDAGDPRPGEARRAHRLAAARRRRCEGAGNPARKRDRLASSSSAMAASAR